MQSHLYFICPTDHLEPIINEAFQNDNYYYTSLGNSIVFNTSTVGQIQELIKDQGIQKITFVLSDENAIILDGIGQKAFTDISGLSHFYNGLVNQSTALNMVWKSFDFQTALFSYYLQSKIVQLENKFLRTPYFDIPLNGLIYKKEQGVFNNIYGHLIYKDYFSLN